MSQENVEIVRGMLLAFNEGDVGGVLAAFDEDCQVEEPPEMPDRPARGFLGHEGIREWMANLRGVAQARFEPRSFMSGDELVFMELGSRGRGEASGVPFEWTTFAVIRLNDGKITRVQAYLDRDEALEAAELQE